MHPLPNDKILGGIFANFGFELERIDRMRRRQSKTGLYEAVVFMKRTSHQALTKRDYKGPDRGQAASSGGGKNRLHWAGVDLRLVAASPFPWGTRRPVAASRAIVAQPVVEIRSA